jgi:hypothetical protein
LKKDFFGRELQIGDEVAFCKPQYRELVKGKVVGFTPKNVRVGYKWWSGSNFDTYLAPSNFFIKAPTETSGYDPLA